MTAPKPFRLRCGVAFASLGLIATAGAPALAAPPAIPPTQNQPAAGGNSTGAAQELPTEPSADHDTKNLQWYDHTPTLRGTSGATIEGQSEAVVTYDDDGVTGMIKNFSNHDVLIETKLQSTGRVARAILTPRDEMPYKLYAAGELKFSRLKDGDVVPGTTAKLWIKDPFVGRPSTKYTAPGQSATTNERDGWREGTSHHEIWGDSQLWVKRENDGWRIPAGDAFLKRYGNPNTPGTPDWAVFTIHVDRL